MTISKVAVGALLIVRGSGFRPPHRPFATHTVMKAATQLLFGPEALTQFKDTAKATVFVGKKDALKALALSEGVNEVLIDTMLESGSLSTTYLIDKKLSFCTLPETVTRCNHPLSLHKLSAMVQSAVDSKTETTIVKMAGIQEADLGPIAAAVSRAFPLYSQKTIKSDRGNSTVVVTCYNDQHQPIPIVAENAVSAGVRLAARLVDTTPEELTTESLSNECKAVANEFPETVKFSEIVGQDLNKKGYGGLYGVGKAAECPPRLVILEYTPAGGAKQPGTTVLVGKGIVYDTGGLSLKTKTGMPGMKSDMGGAAGMLGAFRAAVELKVDRKVVFLGCLAENAIGPQAFRNDDILKLFSGKTVEINNSDAEGRLVLGDGVAHATKEIADCQLVIDMATLTGAQLVCTGKLHAGILANSAELETKAVQAGLRSGDLVFPMLYDPDRLMDEFDSKVADMKNSVKDRSNAQASCAGHFVESHLDPEYNGGWLHVDMAGPSTKNERGTGYGVALILALLEAPGFA